MTELMQTLYNYILARRFNAYLSTEEYRAAQVLADRLSDKLRQKLAGDTWDTLEKYQDALMEQRDMELEAMFQAAFALCREL